MSDDLSERRESIHERLDRIESALDALNATVLNLANRTSEVFEAQEQVNDTTRDAINTLFTDLADVTAAVEELCSR